MENYYVTIIISGSVIVILFVLWLMYFRSIYNMYSKNIDDKKKELENIIGDAQDMIDELNRFSDYIVKNIDAKNQELLESIRLYDEKINTVNEKHIKENRHYLEESDIFEASEIDIENDMIKSLDLKSDGIDKNISNKNNDKIKKNKVISIKNNKYKQVIEMSKKGIDSTQIARDLKMGKGEIELILGLNR
jgi:hypothetical protein